MEKLNEKLLSAAEKGNDDLISECFRGGASVNCKDSQGRAPLHKAAYYGQDKSVEILIKAGADVHARNNKGATPLHVAAGKGQDKSVQILMEGGADVHARTNEGATPLHWAAREGQDRSVQILVEGGADVHARTNQGWTPLHYAAREGQDRSVQILVEGGADVHARTNQGGTPLHLAAWKGQDRSVQILVEGGADVHARDNMGRTPLHLAAGWGGDRSVQILVEGGADVHARDNEGSTPLHLAAEKGQDRSVQILVEGGVDVHARDNMGWTPLHWAAQEGQDRSVQILMGGGADVHARTDEDQTPLFLAALKKHDKIVHILVEAGADINASTNKGNTPLTLASIGLKDTMEKMVELRIKEFKERFPSFADAKEFKVLVSKGTYNSYRNRVYFAGACNVGKSTLASSFIGEDISIHWNSTDGLRIYFGRNGIDLRHKKMVPLTKGYLDSIFSNVLLGEPSVEQFLECQPSEKQSSESVKRKGILKGLQNFFKRSKKSIFTASPILQKSNAQSIDSTSSELKPGKLIQEQPIKKELPCTLPRYQLPSEMSKHDPSDIHESMIEEIRRGKYKIQIAPSDLVDFGGQRSFDMTHQLFIQQKGAFVLLLNGRKDFDEVLSEYESRDMTTRSIILHWVNSILTYCSSDDDDIYPLIVFAATHKDELTKEEQHKKTNDIVRQLTEMFSGHVLRKRIKFGQLFFINATDRNDPGVESLKEYLVSVAFQQKSWGEKMPVAWVPLELQMAEMRSKNICIISLEELNAMNKNNDDLSLSDDELKHFLQCQHSLGQILYFNVHRLDQYIIVQPTAMVDIMRSFITDKIFWPSKPSLHNILSTASKQGIIKRSDLFQLWEQDEFNKYVPTPEIKEFTAQVLVHLDILVEPKHHETEETDTFLVPCMINQQFPFLQFPYNLDNDKTIFLSYKLSKSTIPNALVYKLIGAALSKWPLKKDGEKLCLYDKAAILSIDQDNDLYLIYSEDRFIIGLSNANSKTNISQDVASVIQECLTFTLKKVLLFYFTCFGQSLSSLDVSDCFTTEVVVQCGDDKCFTPLSAIQGRFRWTCQHQTQHRTEFDLYWVYDQREEEPRGLGKEKFNIKKILNKEPEDKHLIRLAKKMGGEDFYELIINLGLDKTEWDNIAKTNPAHDKGLTSKFIGLLEWKMKKYASNQSPTYKDLSKALIAIGQSDDVLYETLREPLTEDYALANSRLLEFPEDDILDQLSQKIGYHTFELGLELDLETSLIEETVFRYPEDMFKQTYDILTKWKKRTAQPTVCSLMHVFNYVDPRGFRFLQSEYAKSK